MTPAKAPGATGGFCRTADPEEKRLYGAQIVTRWVHPMKGRVEVVRYVDGNRLSHPRGNYRAESLDLSLGSGGLACWGHTEAEAVRYLSGNLGALKVTQERGPDGLTDFERANKEPRP